MTKWSKVSYIKNLSIKVDGGQDSSTIYGNERNCAAVTASFNGMNDKYKDPYLNLSKENIGPHIKLIDFNTGENLAIDKLNDASGLFYSDKRSQYCVSTTDAASTSSGSIGNKLAKVTYYVYGKCTQEMTRMIAVKITLGNGNELSSAQRDENPQKVELIIKTPRIYITSDLEPIEWQLVSSTGEYRKQWVAFVKLKSEFNTQWLDCELDRESFPDWRWELAYISRTTRKSEKFSKVSWSFFIAALGEKSQPDFTVQLAKYPQESYEEPLIFNQEPGALCVVCLYCCTPYLDIVENKTHDGFFKLYDAHGNLGEFKMIFDDPINPTIAHREIEEDSAPVLLNI